MSEDDKKNITEQHRILFSDGTGSLGQIRGETEWKKHFPGMLEVLEEKRDMDEKKFTSDEMMAACKQEYEFGYQSGNKEFQQTFRLRLDPEDPVVKDLQLQLGHIYELIGQLLANDLTDRELTTQTLHSKKQADWQVIDSK